MNCFRKSLPGFQWPQTVPESDEIEDLPPVLPSIMRQLFPNNVSFTDYVQADDNALVGEYSQAEISSGSDTEIDEAIQEHSQDSDSEAEECESIPLVSNKQAIEAVTLLLRHCNQVNSIGTQAFHNSFTSYLNEAITARFNEAKQSSILNYFKPA